MFIFPRAHTHTHTNLWSLNISTSGSWHRRTQTAAVMCAQHHSSPCLFVCFRRTVSQSLRFLLTSISDLWPAVKQTDDTVRGMLFFLVNGLDRQTTAQRSVCCSKSGSLKQLLLHDPWSFPWFSSSLSSYLGAYAPITQLKCYDRQVSMCRSKCGQTYMIYRNILYVFCQRVRQKDSFYYQGSD